MLTDPSSEPVLLSVSGLSGDAGGRGLAGTLGCGLLIEDSPNGQGLICFRHALAARAVYERCPPGSAVSCTPAQAVCSRMWSRPGRWPRLARHFREAAQPKWCEYAEQAVGLALASGDEITAAALLHDLVVRAGLSAQSWPG